MDALDSSTDLSLLASLVENVPDSESWSIFVRKYTAILKRWSVNWGADEHTAEEVLQETCLLLHQKLELYRKQPGVPFRSWLKTVAYRAWLSVVRSNRKNLLEKHGVATDPGRLGLLATPEARDDLMREFDRMAVAEIVELASRKVSAQASSMAWRCFELSYNQQLSSQEVAGIVGSTAPAVLMHLVRVRKLMRQEILELDPPEQ